MTGKTKPKRGEVWWVDFGIGAGTEVQKQRPAVVISNDTANQFLDRFQVVPLTSKVDRLYPGECRVEVGKKSGKAMGNQMATVSIRRFGKRMETLSESDMKDVDQMIKIQLDLS